MGIRRWTAIAVGFVGTLIIVRPGTEVIGPGAIVALGSTVFLGCINALCQSSVTDRF